MKTFKGFPLKQASLVFNVQVLRVAVISYKNAKELPINFISLYYPNFLRNVTELQFFLQVSLELCLFFKGTAVWANWFRL